MAGCCGRCAATDALAPVLVVGWGNDLRGDDAAGRVVAEAVRARDLPGVEVVALQQLTPELAAVVAGRRSVVFVDASVTSDRVEVTPLVAQPARPLATHHAGPAALLALAARLAAAPQHAVLVTVPAVDLGIGTTLSATTSQAVSEAVERVVAWCRSPTGR